MTCKARYPFMISLGITLALCCGLAFLMRAYTAEDALIYYRYIQHCLDGKGLVYNTGERFNGLTSPLYTYLSLAAAYLFRGDIQHTQIGLGAIFLFLTSAMTIPVLRSAISPAILVFLPPLLAGSPFFYKTFGLETMQLLFLIMAALYLFETRRYIFLGIACALLLLTRGESLFLIMTFFAFYLRRHRRLPPLRIYVAPFIILALHAAFTYTYYGSLLPNTFSAKIQQGASGLWGRFAFVHHLPHFIDWFWGGNFLLPAAVVFAAMLGFQTAWHHTPMRILLVFVCLYCSFYVLLNIPDYFWYYGSVFLVVYFLALFGLQRIHDLLKNARPAFLTRYHYAAAALICLLICAQQAALSYKTLDGIQGQTHYRTIGTWIRDHTEPDAKIACIEIGHIGWYSQRYIIDILGLVNPYNADYIGQKKFDAWLTRYTPDYILVWVPLRPHEVSVRRLLEEKRYVLFHEFDFDGWKFHLLRKAA